MTTTTTATAATRLRGGGVALRGLQTALQHREQYMAALRQQRIGVEDVLQQRIGVPRAVLSRHAAPPASATTHSSTTTLPQLVLPAQWREHVAHALSRACDGVVPAAVLHSSDYLYCALVHPTYVCEHTVRRPARGNADGDSDSRADERRRRNTAAAVATLRAQLAMPLELSLCGSAAVRILANLSQHHATLAAAREAQELLRAVDDDDNAAASAPVSTTTTATTSEAEATTMRQRQRRQRDASRPLQAHVPQRVALLDTPALATLPAAIGVAQYILYDRNAFATATTTTTTTARSDAAAAMPSPPHDVCVAAAVALCGAIDLTAGLPAVAAFLDRALRTS